MSTLNGGPGNIVTNGLVLYLDAANYLSYTSGSTTWRDLTPNNNSGSLVNGLTFNSGNAGLIVFDGVDDYVSLGLINGMTGLINTTVTMFFYPTSVSGLIVPLARYSNLSSLNGWEFVIADGVFSWGGRESSAQYLSCAASGTYPANRWYYITGTKSNNIWSIYVNGELKNSLSLGLGNVPFNNNNLYIGTENINGYYLKGNVPIVQIYNRALSSTEILQNYNAQKTRFGLT